MPKGSTTEPRTQQDASNASEPASPSQPRSVSEHGDTASIPIARVTDGTGHQNPAALLTDRSTEQSTRSVPASAAHPLEGPRRDLYYPGQATVATQTRPYPGWTMAPMTSIYPYQNIPATANVSWHMPHQAYGPLQYSASGYMQGHGHDSFSSGARYMPYHAFIPYGQMPSHQHLPQSTQPQQPGVAFGAMNPQHQPSSSVNASFSSMRNTASAGTPQSFVPGQPTSVRHSSRAESRLVSRTAQITPRPRSTLSTSSTPMYPRGPPRKPKQSGHALWVGNLPPRTGILELKDYFAQGATQDIESVFLISKSNCAFVNYRTEDACSAAMARFHESYFLGARLVCRLRQGTQGPSTAGGPGAMATHASMDDQSSMQRHDESTVDANTRSLAGLSLTSQQQGTIGIDTTEVPQGFAASQRVEVGQRSEAGATDGSELSRRVGSRYFVLKSLTVEDLEASVRDGVWATQTHNVEVLNEAFRDSRTVYLIFSANKSGEYYGYARMASLIDINNKTGPAPRISRSSTFTANAPSSIPTLATNTAPSGRVVDDSARGTLFWEADDMSGGHHVAPEGVTEGRVTSGEDGPGVAGTRDDHDWGRPFKLEWLCTTRLPFYKTKGLRNPWNSNRDIKIARDGTEIEHSVGRRLLELFDTDSEAILPALDLASAANRNLGGV